MALELRLIADIDLPLEADGVTPVPLLHAGLVRIGTADNGRGMYDCCNAPSIGQLIGSGLHRKERCPWVHRRRITVDHRWAGE